MIFYCEVWPGEGDSNSRRYNPHRFSRPAHSTTLTSPDIFKRSAILPKQDKTNFKIKKTYNSFGGVIQTRTGE